jgi:hypothetical protein
MIHISILVFTLILLAIASVFTIGGLILGGSNLGNARASREEERCARCQRVLDALAEARRERVEASPEESKQGEALGDRFARFRDACARVNRDMAVAGATYREMTGEGWRPAQPEAPKEATNA